MLRWQKPLLPSQKEAGHQSQQHNPSQSSLLNPKSNGQEADQKVCTCALLSSCCSLHLAAAKCHALNDVVIRLW